MAFDVCANCSKPFPNGENWDYIENKKGNELQCPVSSQDNNEERAFKRKQKLKIRIENLLLSSESSADETESEETYSSRKKTNRRSAKAVKVSRILSEVYRLDLLAKLKDFKSESDSYLHVSQSGLDENIPLCESCASVLSEFYSAFEKFNCLRSLDSYIHRKLVKLESVIDNYTFPSTELNGNIGRFPDPEVSMAAGPIAEFLDTGESSIIPLSQPYTVQEQVSYRRIEIRLHSLQSSIGKRPEQPLSRFITETDEPIIPKCDPPDMDFEIHDEFVKKENKKRKRDRPRKKREPKYTPEEKEERRRKSLEKRMIKKYQSLPGTTTFACPECHLDCVTKVRLTNHRIAEHAEKSFVCDQCGKGFICKSRLKKHREVVHVTDRPYICDQCGKDYKSIHNLKTHIKIAHDEDGRKRYNEYVRSAHRIRAEISKKKDISATATTNSSMDNDNSFPTGSGIESDSSEAGNETSEHSLQTTNPPIESPESALNSFANCIVPLNDSST